MVIILYNIPLNYCQPIMDNYTNSFHYGHQRDTHDYRSRMVNFFTQLKDSEEDVYKGWGLYDAIVGNAIDEDAFLYCERINKTNSFKCNPYLEGIKYIDLVISFRKTNGDVNALAQELFKVDCKAIPAYNSIKELYKAIEKLDELDDNRDDDEPKSKRRRIK